MTTTPTPTLLTTIKTPVERRQKRLVEIRKGLEIGVKFSTGTVEELMGIIEEIEMERLYERFNL